MHSSGTIKDERTDSTTTTNVTNAPQNDDNEPWYDHLASEDDRTKTSTSDNGNSVTTNEGEEDFEGQYQITDTNELQ